MDNGKQQLIFVYGTLKKNGGNNAHATHLGDAIFKGSCSVPGVLVHLGYYPGLVEDKVCRVTGEVYEVTARAIHGMDQYEGTPHHYIRKRIATPWGMAWTYFKNNVPVGEDGHLAKAVSCVASGLWRGGEGDRAPYSEVLDFYQNKRYLEPKFRELAEKLYIDKVPTVGVLGTWDDTEKCFRYPDGSIHRPPGANLKPEAEKAVWTWSIKEKCWFDQLGNRRDTLANVVNFTNKVDTEAKDEPPVRGVEMML